MSTERERVEREARDVIAKMLGASEVRSNHARMIAALVLRERAAAFEAAAFAVFHIGRSGTDGITHHGQYRKGYARAREDAEFNIRALAAQERAQGEGGGA